MAEYVMTLTPVPSMVLITGVRPKAVYKDGKATDEQEMSDGTPVWRFELLVINENGSEQFTVNGVAQEKNLPSVLPVRIKDPSQLRFLGRTYGNGDRNITLTAARGFSFASLV